AGLRLHSVPLLLAVVFLMGTHSAVFGPVKYSILPQHLHADELVGGNALVQMGTFAVILLGTILGGALVKLGGETAVSATVLALAGAGWLASRGVPPAPAPAADLRLDWHPVRETLRIVGFARENRTVFLSILGISWFWFYGALFLAQFPGLTRARRPGPDRRLRRLLHRAAPGARAAAQRAEPALAHHRGQQHPERGLHGAGRRVRHRPARRGPHHPAAGARDRGRERGGGGLHLHAHPRVPDALPRLAAGAHRVPDADARHGEPARGGPVRPGIERVVERTPVPVVPMALRGLWGSFFSRKDGRAMSRPFRRFWSRIECVCGEPVPAALVTAAALQERIAALRGDRR